MCRSNTISIEVTYYNLEGASAEARVVLHSYFVLIRMKDRIKIFDVKINFMFNIILEETLKISSSSENGK